MSTIVQSKNLGMKEAFAEQLKALGFESARMGHNNEQILRIELPIAPCDPLVWLRAQKHTVKIFWAGRDANECVAAIGCADEISGKTKVQPDQIFKNMSQKISSRFPPVRYYGGFCFDSEKLSPEWHSFNKYHFIVPRFEVIKRGEQTIFAGNFSSKELTKLGQEKILKEFDAIDFASAKFPRVQLKLKSSTDIPSARDWKKNVSQQIKKLKKGALKKVVLACQTLLKFTETVDADGVFKKLTEISPNCYHFYFQFTQGIVFVGASPERLFKRRGLKIQTEALAGTRARGETIAEDRKLKAALLNSEKDWHEHQLVADWIRNVLNPMCVQLQADRTFSIVSLKSGHHLITRMQGQLLETVDDATLIERLHPTPAVAGWPKDEAMQIIRTVEPFSRGYYAAPIGYIGHDEAEFAVAIRSGLIEGKSVRLYAGAGIVDASQAEEEWEETQNKLKVFLTALDLCTDTTDKI